MDQNRFSDLINIIKGRASALPFALICLDVVAVILYQKLYTTTIRVQSKDAKKYILLRYVVKTRFTPPIYP